MALIEELVEAGHAYPAGGDVYFRVSSFADYGKLSGRHGDEDAVSNPSEEEEPSELKEDPRDFALWKAHKEGEDTSWESPWGRGRPGWHIECSAMAEVVFGPAFEIHGGGLDLVFPHHENEIAQSRSLGHEFARIWMHNGMLRLAGEKMSKSLGNIVSLREALDTWGRETLLVYFLGAHWRKPIDFSDEALEQAAAVAEGFRNVFRSESAPVGEWEPFARALDEDFNTPDALAVMHGWRDHELLRRGLEVFGLESLGESREAPAELEELARKRVDARLRARLRRGRPPARRDRARRLGGQGRRGRAGLPARSETVTTDLVYGRRPVREAVRGPREVLELWATERALKAEPWLQEAGVRIQRKPERDLNAEAGTNDHQGVLARVEPFRYADAHELAAGPAPLLAVLDSVTDPRNLGAVVRSADGAGASGVVLPAHNSARVTPAVCRASAGAVEHLPVAVVTNLARYLGEVKGQDLWVWAADGEAEKTMWEADLTGGIALVFGAEGKGLRPLVRRTCDDAVAIPLVGPGRVAECERRRGSAALRGEKAAWLSRPSTCSTATTSSTQARSTTHASSSTGWPASSRFRARVAWSCSTASARSEPTARSRCGTRRTPTRFSSVSPRRTAIPRPSVSSPRTRPSAAPRGRRCRSEARRRSSPTSTSPSMVRRAVTAWAIAWTKKRESVLRSCVEAKGPVKENRPQGLETLLGPCYLDPQPKGEACRARLPSAREEQWPLDLLKRSKRRKSASVSSRIFSSSCGPATATARLSTS